MTTSIQQAVLCPFERSRRGGIRRREMRVHVERPEDPLLELAYWSHLLDYINGRIYDAAAHAREAGHGWPVIALAYGDRTQQAAHAKFAKVTG